MKFVKICAKLLSVLALGLFVAVLLQAQQETGSIIGTVQDPSGLGAGGAQVSVRNQDTAAMFGIITKKRDSSGLTLLANYTRSRPIGNTDFAAQSPYDVRNAYGPLAFDVGHRASISAVYELPFGAGKALLSHVPRAVNQIVSGWEINGVQTLQGGLRVTPSLTGSLGTPTFGQITSAGDPRVIQFGLKIGF
jgi:hypothetical protein